MFISYVEQFTVNNVYTVFCFVFSESFLIGCKRQALWIHVCGLSQIRSGKEQEQRQKHYWPTGQVEVPGQRGGNVTLSAAISKLGVLHSHIVLGPYNTQHSLTFLDGLCEVPFARENEQGEDMVYVVFWDNVSFQGSLQIREWFNMNPQFVMVFLPQFLNPIEVFFSAWRWKVYDSQKTFCRQWTWLVMISLLRQVRAGSGTPDLISHVLCQVKTLPVMWMKSCGLTRHKELMVMQNKYCFMWYTNLIRCIVLLH